jgi:trimethylamine--corrinoid protein Co-methyltransferase
MLRNTEKPIIIMDYGTDVSPLLEMAEAVVGEGNLQKRPILCMYSEPISPLKHGEKYLKHIITFAKFKLPIVYIPSPMFGATAPTTLAGGIAQANAETLSGNAIVQLVSEKSPFIYGADPSVMDMKTGVFSYGSPEWMLSNIALAQLGRYYNLPVWSTGGCSDSKVLDSQASLEAALTLFTATSTGANLIHDFGFLDFGMTGSLELVTICDEITSLIERVLCGIEVNEETIAIDVIEKVGPGGHFLTQKHTLKFYRRAQWFPTILDRNRRSAWNLEGSKDLVQRAKEKTIKILESHQPNPLPKDIGSDLDNVVERAERRLLQEAMR